MPAGGHRLDGIEIRNGFPGRKGFLAGLALVCAVAPLFGQAPPVCREGRTALVLSGGGAKGVAHIGVLAALDALGARPDLIVGTSMGAIVGALYASGLSAAALDSMTRAIEIDGLLRAPARVPVGWGDLTPLVIWEQGEKGFTLQTPSLREAQAAATLNGLLLRGNLLARGDFDSLPIPFRAVATDLVNRQPVVLAGGDLARAARASSSIPLVFAPVHVDGRVLVDGGISANIPIRVARDLGANRVIVSDVSRESDNTKDLSSPLAVADQLAGFLFVQPPDSLGPEDVYIRPDIEGFGNLDFSPGTISRLMDRGRSAADTSLDQASCLPRAPRRSVTVPSMVGTITGQGLTPGEVGTLRRLLALEPGEAIDQATMRRQFPRLAEIDAYRQVWVTPTGGDPVDFVITADRTPRRALGMGLAYDNELGGRIGFAVVDRAFTAAGVEAAGTLAFGGLSTQLEAGLRRHFGVGRSGVSPSRLAPTLTARLRREEVRRFQEDGAELPAEKTRQGVFFVGVERDVTRWIFRIGLEGRLWHTDLGDERAGGLLLLVRRLPERGPAVVLEGVVSGTFQRYLADLSGSLTAGRVSFLPRLRVGWGDQMPSMERFALGGIEGFPGYHLLELRGDREIYGGTQVDVAALGPLSVTLLAAVGRIATGGGLLEDDHWRAGARLGILGDTPLGPVRLEYGVGSGGRGALLVRVGRWF